MFQNEPETFRVTEDAIESLQDFKKLPKEMCTHSRVMFVLEKAGADMSTVTYHDCFVRDRYNKRKAFKTTVYTGMMKVYAKVRGFEELQMLLPDEHNKELVPVSSFGTSSVDKVRLSDLIICQAEDSAATNTKKVISKDKSTVDVSKFIENNLK